MTDSNNFSRGRASSLLARAGTRLKYPVLLLLFTITVFWKIILTREYSLLTYPDSANQSYPWYQFIVRSLRAHTFPFWDPFVEAGRSFIGEAQTGAFYPGNWLMALFPLNSKQLVSVNVIETFAILHCFLACLFAYFLARHFRLSRFSSFVAGLVFGFSGSIALRSVGQINAFVGSVWVPLVFLFFFKACASERRNDQLLFAGLGGLSLALSLLAGHHQPFLYGGIALALTSLFLLRSSRSAEAFGIPTRVRVIWVTALLFGFALAFSCLQLFPSLEYSHYSYRSISEPNPIAGDAPVPYSVAGTKFSLTPAGVLNLVFPYFTHVENSPYFGIFPLLLVLLAVSVYVKSAPVQLWLLLAIFFLVLALGAFAPLHGIFYALVPGYNKAREAARNLLITHLAVAMLAGFGCAIFFAPLKDKFRPLSRTLIQVLAAIALLIFFGICAAYFYKLKVLGQPTNFDVEFVASILLLLALGIALSRYHVWVGRKTLKLAVVLVCLLDFHSLLSPQIRPKDRFDRKTNLEPAQYYQSDAILDFLRSQSGVFRTDFRNNLYPQNIGEVYALDTVNGHGATVPREFAALYAGGDDLQVTGLLNVKYVVSNAALPLPRRFEDHGTVVYENPHFLPRAWFAKRIILKPQWSEALSAVRAQSAEVGQTAFVEQSGPAGFAANINSCAAQAQNDSIQYTRLGADRFSVAAHTSCPTLLVVSENWFPGWRASLNAKPTPVRRVDGSIMGVYVEAGDSKIEFQYRPSHFKWLLGVTLAACAALIVSGLVWLVQTWPRTVS